MKNKKKIVQKKILILGATSFIGFNLCLELFKKNFQILGVTSLKINKEKKLKLKILRKKKITIIKKNLLNEFSYKYFGSFDVIINCIGWTKNFNKSHYNFKKVKKNYDIFFDLIQKFLISKEVPLYIEMGSSTEYGRNKNKFFEGSKCKPITKYGLQKK